MTYPPEMLPIADGPAEVVVDHPRQVEAVAKAIYWRMNAVMHDHAKNWRECGKQEIYRDCARAAIVAAAHFPEQ